MLALLADPDVASEVTRLPLSELRTLAAGFRDLSGTAAAQSTLQAAPAVRPLPATSPIPPPARAAIRIFGVEDVNVVPPIAVRQSVAGLSDVFAVRSGILEIVIDETGAVESATMRTSVNPVFDRLVLATAKTWRYKPALLAGEPVKFRKIFQLDPRTTR